MTDIPKTYDPKQTEQKWYRFWTDNNLFRTDPASGSPAFCIMMPPPNITGELHMGHALQDSLQDMLIRLKRMQGYEALWQPGKDHAGIATQNVVEKSLAKEGVTRQQLGREAFIERVWQWKEKFGNRIFEQKRLLGDSADWSRERFTLDEGLSKAVAQVFVWLFNKGLIYRGYYIVNWCPRCHTAISDEEVEHEEHQGHLWYFRYPLKSEIRNPKSEIEYVTVATTRPETMLGDTAIAVNPDDERFRHLWDATVILPLAEREIPIIRDSFVDPKFGTGQVKVTPAHDPDDFAMAQRHNLEKIVVMDEDGQMNKNVPVGFRGMDRFDAREAVVKALQERGLVEKIEPYTTSIGHCQRCNAVIEPYLSRQWFVKMKPLAEPAIEAVRDERIKFFPPRWEKVYYQWMENIRDWCISRQLWWGHRIPVWYCQACGAVIVQEDAPDICPKCGSSALKQDEDVLDTWFSSWLWSFSTLGWPERTPELKFWHPTDVLISGYDIIFFWIARMIMAGLEFTGEIPFRAVYITGMVRDEQGRWMSKSLGNGIDPGDMVEQYGGDAVRFTLISLASEGQDIRLAPSRFEGGRNFANKLWNTYRFLMTNLEKLPTSDSTLLESKSKIPHSAFRNPQLLADRWIVSRLGAAVEKVLDSADRYKLNDCSLILYDFVWKEYCDWYLELIKTRLISDTPEGVRRTTLTVALTVFEAILRLMHPAMPFITEEMWQPISDFGFRISDPNKIPRSVMVQPYPQAGDFARDLDAERQMDVLQRLITAIRNIRSEMRVPPERPAELVLANCRDEFQRIVNENSADIRKLATLSHITFSDVRPAHSTTAVVDEVELFIPLADLIDMDVERKRLGKEIARLEGVMKGAEAKLGNASFMDRAPEEIKEHERRKLEECRTQLEAVKRNRQLLD
jgi:valyl-tRNA synthetase